VPKPQSKLIGEEFLVAQRRSGATKNHESWFDVAELRRCVNQNSSI
jgi:hypothetical protein